MYHFAFYSLAIFLGFSFLINLACSKNADENKANLENQTLQQKAVDSNIQIKEDLRQIINKNGWDLPSLSLFSKKTKTTIVANKVKLVHIEYIPIKEVVVTANGNHFKNAKWDSTAKDKSWIIRSLKVFEFEGKPFCYFMRGDEVLLDENRKIIAFNAMTIGLVYFDNDGDGNIETFSYAFPFAEIPQIIPSWIKSK